MRFIEFESGAERNLLRRSNVPRAVFDPRVFGRPGAQRYALAPETLSQT
jgi:hypothetical protein